MQKILLLCSAFALSITLNAQSTALDFDKNDCDAVNHHLFAELEAGNVIILEFVMMDCQPCVTAGNALKTIQAQFEASNPGKVHLYSMGFMPGIKCTPHMNNWKTNNNFNHTIFAGDADQVSPDHGGMGMPTIVILGGLAEHKVYYNHQGFNNSQIAPITAAINLAISESVTGTHDLLGKEHFSAFPNPFDNTLTVQLKAVEATHISLTDIAGKEVLRQEVRLTPSELAVNLATEILQPGFYLVALYNGDRQIGLQKLVKE